MPKYVDIDFEFNKTKQAKVHLVCCSMKYDDKVESFWLYEGDHTLLIDRINELNSDGYIFRAYNAVAEARSFISLGLNPLDYKWIDEFLEWRCLKNHSDELMYGLQLIDGKIKRGNRYNGYKAEDNLAACTYKLLKVQIDTEHKDFIRDLIISAPQSFSEEEKSWIIKYCESDLKYMESIFIKMKEIYEKRLPKSLQLFLKDEMLYRGEYACRTAIMESLGYPYSPESVKNFANSVSYILDTIAQDINEQFPEVRPFQRKPATRRFSMKQKPIRDWIDKSPYADKWELTDGGKSGNRQYSLSQDAFTKFFDYRHDFPRNNFGAQIVRYLKTKQAMNGFMPKNVKYQYWETLRSDGEKIIKTKPLKKSRTFFDYTDPVNGRVHPYMNIYGAQSSRSQPAATGFIPLKSAWMRALIEPKPGKACAGVDWGQQEFLIKMLESGDVVGINAYESGDVYLFFGKEAGEIPKNGTKATHEDIRNKFKSTTLGIQFAMTKFGLAIKLTNDTGKEYTEDEAQELITLFEDTFPEAHEHGNEILEDYASNGFIRLPDGYYMWGDNQNDRSVKNCPIQGFGACIMRKGVALAQDRGLNVMYTLHDAIYIEEDTEEIDEKVKILCECMDMAFRFYFKDDIRHLAYCRLDADVWSSDFNDVEVKYSLQYNTEFGVKEVSVKKLQKYVDSRAASEYHRFSKYFDDVFKIHLL